MINEMYCLLRRRPASRAGFAMAGMNSGASVARSTGCMAGGFDVKRG